MIFFRIGVSIAVICAIVGVVIGKATLIEHKWLGICIGAGVLWMTAGAISMHLVRPLSRVAQVARDIGDGDLSSRVSLRHAPGEIGELATAINEMAERIERQLEDQRALLAAVSHEIRTPLGHMRVIAELVRAGDTERLVDLEREIMDVDTLVDQLLASSRIDFSTLSPRPLDLADVCLRALERAGIDAETLSVECDDTSIEGDAMLLTRAVGNLLDNARRHGDELESVTVTGDADRLRIAVRDRGPGFSDETLATAFERFRGGGDGSLGLGLALVRRIAEAHDGTAEAHNVDGGAEVAIELLR
jgi:signal transduction histidine kinase